MNTQSSNLHLVVVLEQTGSETDKQAEIKANAGLQRIGSERATWLDFVDEVDVIDVEIQDRDTHIHKEDPRDLEGKRIELHFVQGICIQGAWVSLVTPRHIEFNWKRY